MRNKNYIIGALAALALIIITMVLVIIFWTGGNDGDGTGDEDNNPFGDTSGLRPIATSTVVDPFGDTSSQWLTGGQNGAGKDAPALRIVTKQPALGAVVVTKTSGSSSVEYARYVDRSTGHVLETPLAQVVEPTTISFRTALRVGEVLWTPDGETTLIRYLSGSGLTIGSYLGTLSTSSNAVKARDLDGRTLPNNVISAAFSPDSRSVFYILPTESGAVGYIESIATGARREVWVSPLQSLTAVWKSTNTILVYTNPSIIAPGFLWMIHPNSGVVDTVMGERYALAALPDPTGQRILYSMHETEKGIWTLRMLDIPTGNVFRLPIRTLVEKCTWGPAGSDTIYCAVPRNMEAKNYLEFWYQGALSSDDILWSYNLVTGTSQELVNPVQMTQTKFDIVDISVGEEEDYVVFRTRDNDWIWAADLPDFVAAPTATTTPTTEEVVEEEVAPE